MQLGDLKRYGILEQFIEVWRQRQGDLLLPVQSQAVAEGLLEPPVGSRKERRMIIAAPTSSGKSFCAEMAMSQALAQRKRAVLLLPLKSLAEEKYRLFCASYGPLGIKTIIVSSDHPENDFAFASGNYHLALVIYEKFDLALTGRLSLLSNIGLVVVDEIQMISEPGRGSRLERLLTKILASGYYPDILALSAALADRDVTPLAAWLDAKLITESSRPRDLLRGVAAEGRYTYRSYNTGKDDSTACVLDSTGDGTDDAVRSLAEQIRTDGGSTLLFVKSRADAVSLALGLAAAGGYPPAQVAIERLSGEEPSSLLRSLTQALRHGVAFHNSDLAAEQRTVVEQAFAAGEIKVLCSTTTLALGVNLPADTVYLETVKYASNCPGQRAELTPISRAEFENMSGRAGRLGQQNGQNGKPGRAIVMADSAFEREVLWENYVAPGQRESMTSAWSDTDTTDWVLDMLVCGLAGKRSDLETLLKQTFVSRVGSSAYRAINLDEAIDSLEKSGLVISDVNSQLHATPPGVAAARAGLSQAEVGYFLDRIDSHGYPESEFGWLCLALGSPRWYPPPKFLSWYEQAENRPVKMLYHRFDYSVEEAVEHLPPDHRRQPLGFRSAAALKAALLLDDWRRLTPVRKLEEGFGVHLGQIQAVGSGAAHLLASLATLVRATDLDSPHREELKSLAFSVRFGLPASFRQLRRHFAGVLNRLDFGALFRAGIGSLTDLSERDEKELQRVLGDATKLTEVMKIMHTLKEEVDMQPAVLDTQSPLGHLPKMIEIDGSFESDRYLVRINGFPVRLTGKSFKYLTKLAWSRLNEGAGWIFKEDIEVGFNQARYLYRMKNEINASFKSDWPVVENNRLGYYRLHIEPDKIKLNVDNLRSHPDFELRSLFDMESGRLN